MLIVGCARVYKYDYKNFMMCHISPATDSNY